MFGRSGLRAAALVAALCVTAPSLGIRAAWAAEPAPSRFTAVSAEPGTEPGEVRLRWRQDGEDTDEYVIETALTSFSATNPDLPAHGRASTLFRAPAAARALTLSAAQTSAAGAPVGSANHLYYRISAVNHTANGDVSTYWPHLQTVAVRPAVPAATGTELRIGSFNVRTARATTELRPWLERVPAVAQTIVDHHLGVVALQELGPGRADGQLGTTQGTPRQTDSLLTALATVGAGQYRLVRTTPYVEAGTPTATQGMRILYDASRYDLLSECPDTSGDGAYSPSCSVVLPIRDSGDSEEDRLRAAYAEFADRGTGERFFLVSVHLDSRRSTDAATERTYEALRGAQAQAAVDAVQAVNTDDVPIVLGGDLNSWQNNKVGYSAHDALVADGFYDTAAAQTQVNVRYTTYNAFADPIPEPATGFGARLDALLVKGVVGARSFENVMKVVDPARPSDHNLIVADITLPEALGRGCSGS